MVCAVVVTGSRPAMVGSVCPHCPQAWLPWCHSPSEILRKQKPQEEGTQLCFDVLHVFDLVSFAILCNSSAILLQNGAFTNFHCCISPFFGMSHHSFTHFTILLKGCAFHHLYIVHFTVFLWCVSTFFFVAFQHSSLVHFNIFLRCIERSTTILS